MKSKESNLPKVTDHLESFIGVCYVFGDSDCYLWYDMESGKLESVKDYDSFIKFIQKTESKKIVLNGPQRVNISIDKVKIKEAQLYVFDNFSELDSITGSEPIAALANFKGDNYLALHIEFEK